jgi:cyclic pyranopterin phosphate synthase
MSDRLTHLDERGRARMVDVGAKPITERMCVARAEVRMAASTLERISAGGFPKGDVLAVARLAGIQAAKRTADWIPLAHPIALDAIEIDLTLDPTAGCVRVQAIARAQARTGVEMEALVGVSAASLALYDMCKSVDRGMTVEAVRLAEKRGGKSGHWVRPGERGGP